MSNIALVKNSTYYSSSLIENGASLNIINMNRMVNDNIDHSVIDYNINKKKLNVINTNYILPIILKEEAVKDFTSDDFSYNFTSSFTTDNTKDINTNFPAITTNDIFFEGFCFNIINSTKISNNFPEKIITAEVKDSLSDIEFIDEPFEYIEILVNGNHEHGIKEGKCIANIYNNTKQEIDYQNFKDISTLVRKAKLSSFSFNIENTIAVSKETQIDGFENQQIIEMDVLNQFGQGTGSGGSNTGGDLDKLIFTIQQMSFFEFMLVFKSKKVNNIFNLPQGLFFDKEKQRIVGTPVLSGRYVINLTFDNDSVLDGIIEVPKLNRQI